MYWLSAMCSIGDSVWQDCMLGVISMQYEICSM